jgi:hypothetical protein
MPRVIDIQRRHMELGRIRMGEKGAKGQPSRLETWRLTSASRDLLDSAAAVYGGTVEEWKDAPDKGYWQLTTDTAVLDVIVPPGDPYSQFYELWTGGGCKRRCNGSRELLSDSPCKCDPEERECKITTRINVMLPRIAGLGVWRLESHGYYAAAELPDQLDLLQQISGGRMVSGLLRIEQRSSKRDGRTNRYPVPVLDLPNVTLGSLIGNQVVVNPPALLEQGKPALSGAPEPANESFTENEGAGWGDRPALPSFDTPGQAVEAEQAVSTDTSAPAPAPATSARERLLTACQQHGISATDVEKLAALVGVPANTKATDEQIDAIIQMIETGETTRPNESTAVPTSEAPTPDAAVTEAAGVPPAPAASEPPDHGTTEYRAWFYAQSQKIRMELRAQGLGPSDRPKKPPVQPDAPEVVEQVGAAL